MGVCVLLCLYAVQVKHTHTQSIHNISLVSYVSISSISTVKREQILRKIRCLRIWMMMIAISRVIWWLVSMTYLVVVVNVFFAIFLYNNLDFDSISLWQRYFLDKFENIAQNVWIYSRVYGMLIWQRLFWRSHTFTSVAIEERWRVCMDSYIGWLYNSERS